MVRRLAAEVLAQRGVVAAHDAVHQIGRELLQPDLAEGGDALALFRNLLVHHSLCARRKPEPPPRPAPGWVDAPMW